MTNQRIKQNAARLAVHWRDHGEAFDVCPVPRRGILVRSHVVPGFLYRPHYDEKHRALLFDKRDAPYTMVQKGPRERLLCEGCEARLQVFEDYFARYWFKRRPLPARVVAPEVILSGIDYTQFKLFLLSVVSRGSVSGTSPEMSLGPHEERMRGMLINADPGPGDRYPIFGGVIVDEEGQPWDGAMLAPLKIRVKAHWACRMVFGCVAWTVLTSGHQTLPLEEHFLSESGDLRLPALPRKDFFVESGLAEAINASMGEKPR